MTGGPTLPQCNLKVEELKRERGRGVERSDLGRLRGVRRHYRLRLRRCGDWSLAGLNRGGV